MTKPAAISWNEEHLGDGRSRVSATHNGYQVEITFADEPGAIKWITCSQGLLVWRMTRTSVHLAQIKRNMEAWLRGGPWRV